MAGVKKRGGGRRNPSNRTSGTSQTANHRPANLPPQYTFTPANHRVPETDSQGTPVPNLQPPARPTPSYRDYPPPTNLFQHSRSFPGTSPSGEDPTRRPFPQPLASAMNPPEFSSQLRESPQPRPFPQPLASATNPPEFSSQLRESPQPSVTNHHRQSPQVSNLPRESPLPRQSHRPLSSQPGQPRAASASLHSSQAQNSHEEEADSEDDGARESNLPADVLASLHDMLVQPGREKYTTVLSLSLERGTTW
ncbi:PREDICTED: serine/arginine repetitive matrix protein 1-like [Camelina sativa]|uniref:Serine/arginine repetitive matrix protein 1-like n=1 Tax=Camelina sativa TaxID=90675 RepID=A0ABM0YJ20_CAMSA|nr:PREDICTED: serine/arginine repetitive matrix protein 1-like [Camelina sativa]